mmetsp:Transcript_27216/g.61746  ORF Transcript_27216/g.61746 Transcript_27216/m.61746 type:complete len:80 (+) Transcript_27216:88-327(+)
MVPPPWWILADIKPAGPEKDMGTWTAISFSKEQQEMFFIDEHGKAVDEEKFQAALEEHHKKMEAAAAAESTPAGTGETA